MTVLLNSDYQIYHIGDQTSHKGLDCNPYLLISGKDAVLFDPGSNLDYQTIYNGITQIIPIENITYVILHHQDPDFCSAVPHLENMGLSAKIMTSWRTSTLIQYYGIQSPITLIEESSFRLELDKGRTLRFLLTPYLHFAGAFVTYDIQSKTLFSSDLFGAYSYNPTFYADETYMGKMLTFHEHYMPANSILRPVMETFLTYDIQQIYPQHGSIITEDPRQYIDALRNLECGTLLNPIKRNLLESGGYIKVFNEILNRLMAIYSKQEVLIVLQNVSGIRLNDEGFIENYSVLGKELWESLFETIKTCKGIQWLTVIEPEVRTLCLTYDLPTPSAFYNLLEKVMIENKYLTEINNQLDESIKSLEASLIRCPITGLHNELFLNSLMLHEIEHEAWRDVGALLMIGIDNLSKIKFKYGEEEDQHILMNFTYLLKELFGESSVFKMNLCDFAVYVKGHSEETVIQMAEDLRSKTENSDLFIMDLTVSIGVCFNKEMPLDNDSLEGMRDDYLEIGLQRLRKAKLLGKNRVEHTGSKNLEDMKTSKVLIVDPEITNISVLKQFFTEMGIEVLSANDGVSALAIATRELPGLIISEIQIPQMDGFLLKENLLKQSATKEIEVIFMSHYKNEDSVRRSLELGVFHYIKKPYLLSEVLGIARKKLKGLVE